MSIISFSSIFSVSLGGTSFSLTKNWLKVRNIKIYWITVLVFFMTFTIMYWIKICMKIKLFVFSGINNYIDAFKLSSSFLWIYKKFKLWMFIIEWNTNSKFNHFNWVCAAYYIQWRLSNQYMWLFLIWMKKRQ